MKHSLLPLGAAVVIVAGCGLPQDEGVVMGCFGLVNETIPGQDVFSNQVVTNMFFGGCSPDDVGMQIMERATLTASQDQVALAARCDTDCKARLDAYKGAHPEVDLPLSCQTLFASPCDGLGADVTNVGGSGLAFQAGGPADTRFTLVGTVALTVNGVTTTVPAGGIVDGTLNGCPPGTQNCPFTLSRFDVIPADQPLVINGTQVDKVQVQNQGLITGNRTPSNMSIAINAIEAEVSTSIGGVISAFHVRNSNAVTKTAPNLTLEQFLSSIDVPMTGPGGVSARIVMTGQPFGHRPVAAITALQTTYECQCKECTTAEFASAATDVDNDLNSLAWKVDGQPQIADGTGAPQTLALQVGVGPHTVSLVATDSRGAAAGSTQSFNVVDTTPPVFTVPPVNMTFRSCDFPDIPRLNATDTCSDPVVVTSNSPGNFPVGTTTVTWTAEDLSGNQNTTTQTITVTNVTNFQTCCPAGYNVIIMQNGVPTSGTPGNDCIIGTDNNDNIGGGDGDDIIFGRGGQDTINGGNGNDVILAGEGINTVNGGNGDDGILGGGGTDTITGGAGDDTLTGGGGDDTINGNEGNDLIYGNQGQDRLTGGPGFDLIDGGSGDDQITTGTTPAAVGNAGDDILIGGENNDTITDTLGNNTLEGFSGDDRLTGGPGFDTLLGGQGRDTCAGGGGTDRLFLCND